VIQIQLSVNYSSGLAELLSSNLAPIHAIEFTPWFSPEQISSIRRKYPHLLFHFHHGNLIARLKWDANTYKTLLSYLACTDCPWISAHISMLPPGHVFLARYLGIHLRGEPEEVATRWFLDQVAWLQARVSTPLILENMPSLSPRRYAYEVDPLHIHRILDQTGTGFLLDLAHARVVASIFQRDVYEYLLQLPLDRTVQIHVSGPRLRRGMLYDAHEPMQEEDYRLLEWVLDRTRPQVVTLEYYKEKNRLAEQLTRLSAIL
jgi:uncharacterized protein (UPF0276 family)